MLVLGIETSCDETGIALYDSEQQGRAGLLAHALHSQIAMHNQYGGVVPELASRDHIRYLLPLVYEVLSQAGKSKNEIGAIAYTQGPGLAGALLTGAAFANALAMALGCPIIGVHHLEGHLLSPLLSETPPEFPFVALLVSGGHTQLMKVTAVGDYVLLGETLDDAAGECFDKTAKLLGLAYPGGPAVAALALQGVAGTYTLPRPMLRSGNLDFSFAGLKTAVLNQVKKIKDTATEAQAAAVDRQYTNLARDFVDAAVEVLVTKSMTALAQTGLSRLVVAGGVGANVQLRQALNQASAARGYHVYYPELELCTDNGAMIAFAGALRLRAQKNADKAPESASNYAFEVRPRWPLNEL